MDSQENLSLAHVTSRDMSWDMPPPDAMTALAHRIVPIMQDHGLSAFVLAGYLSDADGNLKRVCIANTMRNPAFEDGLRALIQFAHLWGSVPRVQPPESPPTESSGLAPE